MRSILSALGALFISLPAMANDRITSVTDLPFRDIAILHIITSSMCRMGDAPQAVDKAVCDTRTVYAKAMEDAGYCFDSGEWDWAKCKK